jgi:hypothetical protein
MKLGTSFSLQLQPSLFKYASDFQLYLKLLDESVWKEMSTVAWISLDLLNLKFSVF